MAGPVVDAVVLVAAAPGTTAETKSPTTNNCKHCNAIDPPRKNCTVGGGSKAKCLWNPDYKGWRPDWVCGRMGIVFKKKGKFTKELGGTKEE